MAIVLSVTIYLSMSMPRTRQIVLELLSQSAAQLADIIVATGPSSTYHAAHITKAAKSGQHFRAVRAAHSTSWCGRHRAGTGSRSGPATDNSYLSGLSPSLARSAFASAISVSSSRTPRGRLPSRRTSPGLRLRSRRRSPRSRRSSLHK